MPDLPTFIGRYRVVERLSSGGMGVLYLARDPAIDRTVAIKVARVHSVELRQRFLREARATGRLNHRNIVTIFDVGEHDGEPFIAMEYVPGRTLADMVRRNTPLPLLRRLRMLRELCDGLAYAHSQSIIHRDIKPANLISREDSGALTILDFGIARLSEALTSGAAMIGTPNYMAPEQIDGAHVDHRCDIFAVGLVFYELLSYRRAFGGDSPTAVIYKVVHEQPVPLAEVVPDLDSGLIRAVDRALAKRADDRYQHLSELIADLDAAIARIEEEDREPESTILVRRADEMPAHSSSASGTPTRRAELIARREAQLAAHLDAANAALENERCDAAQGAADQAALLDLDDDRVLQMLDRIATVRVALQVDEHVSNARGHLKELALTQASESVDLALQLQPESPAALQLSRDIESRRAINRWLEEAEQQLASGEFVDAIRSAHEVLTIDPAHEAALRLKDRINTAARDHRARAAVDKARRKRTAGELAAAQKILAGFDEPHDLVAAELASVKKEIRELFESSVEEVRDGLEHGNLQDAQSRMRKVLQVFGEGAEPAQPSIPRQPPADPSPLPDRSLLPARPVDTTAHEAADDDAPERGDERKRLKLVATLSVAVAVIAIAVSIGMGLASRSTSGQESGFAANRDAVPGVSDSAATSPDGSEAPVPSPGEIDPEPDEEEAGTSQETPAEPDRPAPAPPPAPAPAPPRSRSPRPASPPTAPSGPDVDALLADAVAAEAAGEVDGTLDLYAGVLRRDPDNRTALTGRERIQATLVREHLQEGNAAFTAGRYDDARRLFQDAVELNGSPAAAEGLRRVDNAEALLCGDAAACGTLVVRVAPAAEIIVDDRSLGTTAVLELRLPVGRHRIRLETDEWQFPRIIEIVAGETAEIVVDLEEDGFPK